MKTKSKKITDMFIPVYFFDITNKVFIKNLILIIKFLAAKKFLLKLL